MIDLKRHLSKKDILNVISPKGDTYRNTNHNRNEIAFTFTRTLGKESQPNKQKTSNNQCCQCWQGSISY